eukprot:Clim_evm106s108 gene=Clim_evmTU106s108
MSGSQSGAMSSSSSALSAKKKPTALNVADKFKQISSKNAAASTAKKPVGPFVGRITGSRVVASVGSGPKPVTLASLKKENQGLDPHTKIVPKGTTGWGSSTRKSFDGTSATDLQSASPKTQRSVAELLGTGSEMSPASSAGPASASGSTFDIAGEFGGQHLSNQDFPGLGEQPAERKHSTDSQGQFGSSGVRETQQYHRQQQQSTGMWADEIPRHRSYQPYIPPGQRQRHMQEQQPLSQQQHQEKPQRTEEFDSNDETDEYGREAGASSRYAPAITQPVLVTRKGIQFTPIEKPVKILKRGDKESQKGSTPVGEDEIGVSAQDRTFNDLESPEITETDVMPSLSHSTISTENTAKVPDFKPPQMPWQIQKKDDTEGPKPKSFIEIISAEEQEKLKRESGKDDASAGVGTKESSLGQVSGAGEGTHPTSRKSHRDSDRLYDPLDYDPYYNSSASYSGSGRGGSSGRPDMTLKESEIPEEELRAPVGPTGEPISEEEAAEQRRLASEARRAEKEARRQEREKRKAEREKLKEEEREARREARRKRKEQMQAEGIVEDEDEKRRRREERALRREQKELEKRMREERRANERRERKAAQQAAIGADQERKDKRKPTKAGGLVGVDDELAEGLEDLLLNKPKFDPEAMEPIRSGVVVGRTQAVDHSELAEFTSVVSKRELAKERQKQKDFERKKADKERRRLENLQRKDAEKRKSEGKVASQREGTIQGQAYTEGGDHKQAVTGGSVTLRPPGARGASSVSASGQEQNTHEESAAALATAAVGAFIADDDEDHRGDEELPGVGHNKRSDFLSSSQTSGNVEVGYRGQGVSPEDRKRMDLARMAWEGAAPGSGRGQQQTSPFSASAGEGEYYRSYGSASYNASPQRKFAGFGASDEGTSNAYSGIEEQGSNQSPQGYSGYSQDQWNRGTASGGESTKQQKSQEDDTVEGSPEQQAQKQKSYNSGEYDYYGHQQQQQGYSMGAYSANPANLAGSSEFDYDDANIPAGVDPALVQTIEQHLQAQLSQQLGLKMQEHLVAYQAQLEQSGIDPDSAQQYLSTYEMQLSEHYQSLLSQGQQQEMLRSRAIQLAEMQTARMRQQFDLSGDYGTANAKDNSGSAYGTSGGSGIAVSAVESVMDGNPSGNEYRHGGQYGAGQYEQRQEPSGYGRHRQQPQQGSRNSQNEQTRRSQQQVAASNKKGFPSPIVRPRGGSGAGASASFGARGVDLMNDSSDYEPHSSITADSPVTPASQQGVKGSARGGYKGGRGGKNFSKTPGKGAKTSSETPQVRIRGRTSNAK